MNLELQMEVASMEKKVNYIFDMSVFLLKTFSEYFNAFVNSSKH